MRGQFGVAAPALVVRLPRRNGCGLGLIASFAGVLFIGAVAWALLLLPGQTMPDAGLIALTFMAGLAGLIGSLARARGEPAAHLFEPGNNFGTFKDLIFTRECRGCNFVAAAPRSIIGVFFRK